jgi:hypothetical protein
MSADSRDPLPESRAMTWIQFSSGSAPTGWPEAGAGWYPDPANPGLVRWWDGGRWTDSALWLPAPQELVSPPAGSWHGSLARQRRRCSSPAQRPPTIRQPAAAAATSER